MISIIIPTYNEEESIEETLIQLTAIHFPPGKEIIVADGGSKDHTTSIASKYAQVVRCKKGKAIQLNSGVERSKGDILFFAHADMSVPQSALTSIHNQIQNGFEGGGFANEFDTHNKQIKRLGTIMNFRLFNKQEQSDRCIFYGDNGIFVTRKAFNELGGFMDIPIMEDYDFSVRMKSKCKVKQIKEPKLVVSSRRHLRSGFLKTRFQWIMIKRLYQLGISPSLLAKWYGDVR